MGSTSKRNLKDQVQIGLSSGVGNSPQRDVKCPAQFIIRLSSEFKLAIGMPLSIKELSGVLTIYYGNRNLGTLGEKTNIIIKQCIGFGIIYDGTIFMKEEKYYGLFKRRAA